jgi:hypothetical protein
MQKPFVEGAESDVRDEFLTLSEETYKFRPI